MEKEIKVGQIWIGSGGREHGTYMEVTGFKSSISVICKNLRNGDTVYWLCNSGAFTTLWSPEPGDVVLVDGYENDAMEDPCYRIYVETEGNGMHSTFAWDDDHSAEQMSRSHGLWDDYALWSYMKPAFPTETVDLSTTSDPLWDMPVVKHFVYEDSVSEVPDIGDTVGGYRITQILAIGVRE